MVRGFGLLLVVGIVLAFLVTLTAGFAVLAGDLQLDRYRDRVAFYAVYIEEAHPSDVWQMMSNVREGVVYANPRSDG